MAAVEDKLASAGVQTGWGAWKAVVALVVVVAVGAGGWFLWKSGFLTRALNDHYARTIARVGRSVELRATSYHSVVANLTQLPGVAEEPPSPSGLLLAAHARVLTLRRAEAALEARGASIAAALEEAKARIAESLGKAQPPAEPPLPEPRRMTAALADLAQSLASANVGLEQLLDAKARISALAAKAVAAQKAANVATRDHAQATTDELTKEIRGTRPALGEVEKQLTIALLDLAAKVSALQRVNRRTEPGGALAARIEHLADSGQEALSSLRSGEDMVDDGLARDSQILQSVLPSYRGIVESCLAVSEKSTSGGAKRSDERDLCVARGLARGSEVGGDSARHAIELSACGPGLPRGVLTLNRGQPSLTFTPKPGPSLDVCGSVGLRTLLTGLESPRGELDRTPQHSFDALVVLDDHGRVLLGPPEDSPLRVLKVPGFDEKRATASHVMSEVPLGPRKYSLFLQPLELPLVSLCAGDSDGCRDGNRPAQLILAGLVFEERLASERLEVTPGTYLWAVVLLSVIVLALPLAKLWLLGPTSRLRRFDVSLLVASAAATTLLVTLLSLSLAAFLQLRSAVDDDLNDVGKAIAKSVEQRASDGKTLLDAFMKDTRPLRTAIAANDLFAFGSKCEGKGASFSLPLSACELLDARLSATSSARWDQAFLADATGKQRVKWTSGKASTNLVNVARRPYFTRAKERACESDEPCADSHVIEVVRSLTTGALQLVVAKAFVSSPGGAVEGVAGITLPLPEFQRIVLPLGFQMAVLDGDGKVMLHSGSSAFQGQNFLDDVDSPAALRATIAKQSESWLTLRYLGERSRVRVAGLATSGWVVVVVAPFSLIDVPLSQSVLIAVVAFLLLAVATMCLFGLILLAARYRRRGRTLDEQEALLTLRPRAASKHDYQEAVRFVFLAGLAAPVTALLLPFGLVPLLLLVLCGLVAFGAVMRVPGIGRNGALASLRPQSDGWLAWLARGYLGELSSRPSRIPLVSRLSLVNVYSACCFALAGVVVTAPACVLFAAAHDHMLETLARAQQQHLVRESVPLDCLDGKAHTAACKHVYLPDSPSAPTADVWGSKARNDLLAGAQTWLPQFEPVRGTAAALLVLAHSPPEPPDLPWVWERAGADLRLGPTNQAKKAGLHSDLPTLMGWCAVLPLVGLGAWALGSYLLSLRVFQRLFHMRLLQELGQHSLEDLAIKLGNLSASRTVPVNVYIPILSKLDAAILQGKVDEAVPQPPEWTRDDVFHPQPGSPEPPWVVATFDADPLAQPDPQWLDALRDYDQLRRAPAVHPHLATLAAPKRPALAYLWSRCDDDEKRVLSQIALDDYANPHPNTALVLKRLAEEGLVDASTLAIPRKAFVDYILSTLTPADFEQWAKSEKNTSWTAMRGFLVAALATLAAVLTALQPSLGAATATVPALAAAIPTLLRMLNLFAGSESK